MTRFVPIFFPKISRDSATDGVLLLSGTRPTAARRGGARAAGPGQALPMRLCPYRFRDRGAASGVCRDISQRHSHSPLKCSRPPAQTFLPPTALRRRRRAAPVLGADPRQRSASSMAISARARFMRCAKRCLAAVGPNAAASEEVILGILSLIVWALILIVSVKYVIILLRADNNGEGGTLALMALAQRAVRRTRPGGDRARHDQRRPVLRRRHDYAGAVGAVGGRGSRSRAAGASTLMSFPLAVVILFALFAVQSRGTARVATFFGPITLVWFVALAAAGAWHVSQNPAVLGAFNPVHGVSFLFSHGVIGLADSRSGVSRRHRRRGALCRSRPFRSGTDPHRLVRRGAAGADHQLSRPGGIAAGQSQGDREPVLSALSGVGAAADGRARHGRHRDCQPGGDQRGLLADASGDPTRPPAAARDPPHVGGAVRPNLHAAREHPAADRRAAPRHSVQIVGRARLGLRHRRDGNHGGDGDFSFDRGLESLELAAVGGSGADGSIPA